MKRQRNISNLVCTIFLCCAANTATSWGQGNIATEIKQFLEHLPAIENITFAKMSKGMGDTNGYSADGKLFTAGVQGEDFVMAELRTPEEVPQMSTRTLPIVGKVGSFKWSISGMTLNLGQTNGLTNPDDPAVTLSKQFEAVLDEPMNLGVYQAERGSLRVSESGEFSAPIAKRLISWGAQSEIRGRLAFSPDNRRLETASWQITTRPEMAFHIRYSYEKGQTNFFPSAWECSATRNGQHLISYTVQVFKFHLASSSLPKEFFRPDRFVVKSNLPPVGPIVLTQSNGQTLWLRDGKFQPTKIEQPVLDSSSQQKLWIIRIIIFGSALAGLVIVIRSAFVSAKRRKQDHQISRQAGVSACVQTVLVRCNSGPSSRPDPACKGASMSCTSTPGNFVQARGGFATGRDSGAWYDAWCNVPTTCTDCTGGVWHYDDSYTAPGSFARGNNCTQG